MFRKKKKKEKTEENIVKNVLFQLDLKYMSKKHSLILIMH